MTLEVADHLLEGVEPLVAALGAREAMLTAAICEVRILPKMKVPFAWERPRWPSCMPVVIELRNHAFLASQKFVTSLCHTVILHRVGRDGSRGDSLHLSFGERDLRIVGLLVYLIFKLLCTFSIFRRHHHAIPVVSEQLEGLFRWHLDPAFLVFEQDVFWAHFELLGVRARNQEAKSQFIVHLGLNQPCFYPFLLIAHEILTTNFRRRQCKGFSKHKSARQIYPFSF